MTCPHQAVPAGMGVAVQKNAVQLPGLLVMAMLGIHIERTCCVMIMLSNHIERYLLGK